MMPTTVRQSARPAWLLLALLAACAKIELPTDLTEVPPVLAPPSNVEFTGDIRLGLVPAATELLVGGTETFVIRDGGTGSTLMTGVAETASVRYVEESTPTKTSWRLLSRKCVTEQDRDTYIQNATALGYVTHPEQSADCWNVYLGDLPLSSALSTLLGFQNIAAQKGLATKQDQWAKISTNGSVKGFRIVKGNMTVTTPNFVVVEPSAGRLNVGERQVDGAVKVFRNAAGTLTATNEVPLEQYLRRVVPLVLPPDNYGVAEAQKAHAITERTRALYNIGRHADLGFDFYPGEYQPYGEPEDEHELSTAAIDATAGLVLTKDGQLIDTPLHPVSGGWTANSEDVFEPIIAYLRGISETDLPWGIEKQLTLDAFIKATSTDLRGVLSSERKIWSKFSYWKVQWSKAELAAVLSETFGVPVTSVSSVQITDRGTYGRVRRIEFVTNAGTLVAEKHDIRSKLPYITAEGGREPLSSTLFFITAIQNDDEITGWRAYGAGLGHGVGMSQIGAVMRANNGETHASILTKYYTGVTIEQR